MPRIHGGPAARTVHTGMPTIAQAALLRCLDLAGPDGRDIPVEHTAAAQCWIHCWTDRDPAGPLAGSDDRSRVHRYRINRHGRAALARFRAELERHGWLLPRRPP